MSTRKTISHSWPIDTLGWLGLGLLAVLLSRYTNIDLIVSNWFFDQHTGEFPLRNTFLFSRVLHDGTHKISLALWLACWIMAWRARQTEALFGWIFVIATAFIAVSINGWFKHHSMHSCPWSLTEFGGEADYFRALSTLPPIPGPGRCLPSGHAGVGFMWIPMIYACATWWPRYLRKATTLIVLFALFCGGIQVARGAHFVTHIIWTAVICGLTTSLSFHVYQYRAYLSAAILRISQRLRAESTE